MINKLEISGIHTNVNKKIEKYVNKKIGQLDRYVPRSCRESLHVIVRLKEGNSRDKNTSTCEVVVKLPHETIDTQESTINMYAAIDIVEAKLKQQLKKYKDTHASPRFYRRLALRLNRQTSL